MLWMTNKSLNLWNVVFGSADHRGKDRRISFTQCICVADSSFGEICTVLYGDFSILGATPATENTHVSTAHASKWVQYSFFSTVNNSVAERAGLRAYLRLAMRLLLRPIPRHFSKCGAKREAAMLRLQLGHTHSLFFHWLYTWPKTSNPGWSTISEKWKKNFF